MPFKQKIIIKFNQIYPDIRYKFYNNFYLKIQTIYHIYKDELWYNKQHNSNYKIPIIAFSGDSDEDFIVNLLDNDIDDHLVKGCSGNDMIKLSLKFLKD
ncbi:response regulator [Rickettsiales bacterium]|nr:response regulator [Rickettsiales bacterium]